jgi:hypothetical protein
MEVEYEDPKLDEGATASFFCWINVDDAIELHAYLGEWIENMQPKTGDE